MSRSEFKPKLNDLDTYRGTDQPETCPRCGSRTHFHTVGSKRQLHSCQCCEYVYVVEFD